MKVIRFLTTLLASLLFSTAVFAGIPSEDGKKDEGKAREVPIIVVRGKKIPVMYAPPKPIEITAIVGSGTVSFHLPFDEYPVDVEIEGISGTVGYWTSTITYAGEAMDFDGACGEYRLVLTVGDADYVGYFSID